MRLLADSTEVTIVVTEKNTCRRLEVSDGPAENADISGYEIHIDTQSPAQSILGFGGAFTQSASAVLEALSPKRQEEALQAYFHPDKGIAYNMGRTHIGCCDFSTEMYTLNDTLGDIGMDHFDSSHDERWLIPFIKRASDICDQELLLYAVPWSPPAWMKTNEKLTGGGELKTECYEAMGRYLTKFVEAYKYHGVNIWALGAQNEPNEVQRWASCCYSAEQEKAFLLNGLLPALDSSGLDGVQILIWDSNKDNVYTRAKALLSAPMLAGRAGVAFHWYSGDYFENLHALQVEFPSTLLISTESCLALPEDLTDWGIGERYAHEIIGDINNGTNAFIDFNLFLNIRGGPNMHDNFCTAPIMADIENDRLIYLSSYYYIGHFSKYVQRGALRLYVTSPAGAPELCAFINPDKSITAVVLNQQDSPQAITLHVDNRRVPLFLAAHSIQTIILNK